jgi:hypothetical protein
LNQCCVVASVSKLAIIHILVLIAIATIPRSFATALLLCQHAGLSLFYFVMFGNRAEVEKMGTGRLYSIWRTLHNLEIISEHCSAGNEEEHELSQHLLPADRARELFSRPCLLFKSVVSDPPKDILHKIISTRATTFSNIVSADTDHDPGISRDRTSSPKRAECVFSEEKKK